MSQICDNTTPLGSKGASEILTETAAALQEAIISLDTLANQSNLDVLDRNTVVVSTNALNNILSNMDLSELDSLQAKFDSDDGITYTDLAEFAVANGVNMTELKDELVKFNANLPNGESTNADLGDISDTTGQPANGNTGVVASTFDTGSGASTPVGGSKISTKPPTDLLAEIQRASNITGLLSGRIPFKLAILPDLIAKLLKNLDFHFANNIGSKLTDALCSAFNDVSSKISKAFAIIDNTKVLVQDITNILEKDPKKLLEQMKQRATLETLVGVLENVVKKALEAAKNIALAAVGGTLLALKGLGSAASSIITKLFKEVNNLNDYMSDASVGKIISDIEAVVAKLASSFERLTPEAVSNLMYKMCQMAQDLQSSLMKPAQKLNRMANNVASEVTVLKSQDAQTTQKAVKAGAIRVSEKTKIEKTEKTLKKYEEVKPDEPEADYVAPSDATDEELSIISTLDDSGFTGITFHPSIIAGTDSRTGFGASWKDVKPIVWARLMRLQKQTGEDYVVTRAYVDREPGIFDKTGHAALVYHNSGYCITILCTRANLEKSVIAASRAGFTGIAILRRQYEIQLHLGPRRGLVMVPSPFSSEEERVPFEALMEKHEIDGFRKKRS